MSKFFHIIYTSIKLWIKKHSPKFSLIRYILVVIITTLLSIYYIKCNSPSKYKDKIVYGVHNHEIDSCSLLSFNYDRNHLMYDSTRNERICFAFKVGCAKDISESPIVDSLARLTLDENAKLNGDYSYTVWVSEYWLPTIVPYKVYTSGNKESDKYINVVRQFYPQDFQKNSYCQYSIFFDREELKTFASYKTFEHSHSSVPSWFLYGDLSKFEICVEPHMIRANNYASKVAFEFNDIVTIDKLQPEPDEQWLTGFAYTDSTKITSIFDKGLTGICSYPAMEGWQMVRTFLLTMLLTLLFTLLFTMTVDAIRNHNEIHKWCRFIMFSIIWLIIIYLLYAALFSICYSSGSKFYLTLIVGTLLVTALSFYLVNGCLIKYDVTLLSDIDCSVNINRRLKTIDLVCIIFHTICIILLIIFVIFLFSYVQAYPTLYINEDKLNIWLKCTWFSIYCGFVLPICIRYIKNHLLMIKNIRVFLIYCIKNIFCLINNASRYFWMLTVIILLILEIYCCVFTKITFEQSTNNAELIDLYEDIRYKCSIVGKKDLTDAIWMNNIEDYIADTNIEPIYDSVSCKDWSEMDYANFIVGYKYSIKTYKKDSLLYVVRTNNESGEKKVFLTGCGRLLDMAYDYSPDGRYCAGYKCTDDKKYLLLISDELMEFEISPLNFYEMFFIDNHRFLYLANSSILIFDLSHKDVMKPVKSYKHYYSDMYQYGRNLLKYRNLHGIGCFNYAIVDSNNNIIQMPSKFNYKNCNISYDNRHVVFASKDTLTIYDIDNKKYKESRFIISDIIAIQSAVFEQGSNRLWIFAQTDSSRYKYSLYYIDFHKSCQRKCYKASEFISNDEISGSFEYSPIYGLCMENPKKTVIWPINNPSRPFIFVGNTAHKIYYQGVCKNGEFAKLRIKALPRIVWGDVYDYAYKKYEKEKRLNKTI